MKNVDFRNGRPLVMMVSQYDFGYSLQAALWSNGTPVTITAAEIVSENFTTTCTFSGNVVTIPISTSMTERFGHFPAELRVTDSTGQVSSKNFDFFVERSPLAVKSTQTYSGDIVEFTAKRVPLSSVVVTMEPIQSLNGYDAPWPAGGNKNLIPYPYSADAQTIISSGTWNGMTIAENNGKISVKGTQNYTNLCIFAFFKLKANTTYTFSTNYQYANDSTLMNCTIYDPTKAKLYANPKTATPVTFTTTEECTVRIYLNPSTSNNGRSFDFTIQPQLEEGSSASEWTPYSNICPITGRTGASVLVNSEYSETGATTYPITFTSAGTVYAGTVDFVSGRLEVTHGSVTFDGTENWGFSSRQIRLQYLLEGMAGGLHTEDACKCDTLPIGDDPGTNAPKSVVLGYNPNYKYIYIMSGQGELFDSLESGKAWLASNNVTITYPLETPLTYTLTPTQVMSLLGENVVWSPDGEVEVVVPEFYS